MLIVKNLYLESLVRLNSLIFSNHFILVRLSLDPDPFPGTLIMRCKYTEDEMPIQGRIPCTHTYARLQTYAHTDNLT